MIIDSLCMVLLKTDGYTKQLIRLADLDNGVFVPIRRDEEGIARNILHYPPISDLPDKTVAVFSWEPFYEDGWKQDVRLLSNNWIEVIEQPDNELLQLIEEIKAGVSWSNGTHDLLIPFSEGEDHKLVLYWPQKQMRFISGDGKLACKADVISLYIYKILKQDISECSNERCPDDRRKYYSQLSMSDQKAVDKVFLFTPHEVISTIFIKHIRSFSGLTNRERQAVRRVLNEIENASILHEISLEFECGLEKSQQYYDEYIEKVQETISEDKWDGKLFQNLIDGNSALSERMLVAVESDWKQKNKQTVEQMAQLEKDISSHKTVLAELDRKISINKKTMKQLELLEQAIHEKIRTQLGNARADISTLLTEYAFLLPTGKNMRSNPAISDDNNFLVTSPLHGGQIEEAENLEAAKYNLTTNLGEAGISDTKVATELAQFLISAYCNKINLLVAGSGGFDIATALSAALCNRKPAQLNLSLDISMADAYNILAESEEQIIIVPNALGSKKFEHVLSLTDSLPQKMFIFLSPFSQTLTIEPRGLYQYMLPIFTELYIAGYASRDFIFESAQQAISTFSIGVKDIAKAKSELSAISSALLLERNHEFRVANIKAGLDKYFRDINSHQVCFRALWIPLSVCFGRINELLDEVKGYTTIEQETLEELEMQIERGI